MSSSGAGIHVGSTLFVLSGCGLLLDPSLSLDGSTDERAPFDAQVDRGKSDTSTDSGMDEVPDLLLSEEGDAACSNNVEECNGRDDNCDGYVDEGTGVCDPCTRGVADESRYLFCPDHRTWQGGRDLCLGYGYDLVTITSPGENDVVQRAAFRISARDWWIGLHDTDMDGDYAWVADGRVVWTGGQGGTEVAGAYTNFWSGDPSGNGHHCVLLEPDDDPRGTWHDKPCDDQAGVICETL